MIEMGVLELESSGFVSVTRKNIESETVPEPISVLDTRPSPSPSISGELAPVTGDWEALLSDSAQDQFLLRWISNEFLQGEINLVSENPCPQFPNLGTQVPDFTGICSEKAVDEKPQVFGSFPQVGPNLSTLPNLGPFGNSGNFISHPQVPKFDKQASLVSSQPPLKRPNLGNVESFGNLQVDAGSLGNFVSDPRFSELYKYPPESLLLVPKQVVYDQLYKAAELILSGNLLNAHSILARLNHQLTPGTLPFQRASFYLKEALLQLPLLGPGSGSLDGLSKSPTPTDGLFKMGAYKLLSEVSPLTNFVNFTSNQAILESVGDSERVHVVDFDIGSGAQWASFMTEVSVLGKNKGTLCLKITAFASPLTHHPFELGLMHESLTQLAIEIGVNFELEIVNLDAIDPNAYPVHLFTSDKETTLAVNFPVWAFSNRLAMLPSLIRFVKQLSPKIVMVMEHGCERFDLSFSNHVLHALQYHEALLQSIDAVKANSDTVLKIEKFIVQPRIENIVLGRLSYPNQMPHWRALFAAAGFSQVNISSFAEIQAECVLNKAQARGFHVERRQTSLVLSWQRRELVSASAWRC